MNPHSKTQRVQPQRYGQRADDGARKMLRRVITLLLLIMAGVGVWRLDPLDKWNSVAGDINLRGGSHNSAQALAARIKDVPQCRKYRAEILSQDGKKGDAAEYRMAKAYEDARNDHCLNIDLE